ncbi:MAG: DUF1772 domain-containing protein [Actinomycetota bacterium]|nr:DUF1772 domain-containing protein [Actinomycetota bacterium]
MLEVIRLTTLVAATVIVGLVAGLFFAFAVSVMPGLGRSDSRTFIEAMQHINVAILNPLFAASFVGAPVLTGAAAALHFRADGRAVLPWTVAGFALCMVTLVITIRINVPLNNALDGAGPPDRIADLAGVRERFEATWVRWNVVRAVASTAALGCLAWALVLYGRATAAP